MTARAQARVDVGARDAGARVEAVLAKHRPGLMWIARRWSGSADDAEDALQRAMEIYVRRLATIDPATELAWLKVVVQHEAMALRRTRPAGVPLEEGDLATADFALDERIEREERNAHSLQALAGLKPDERTALVLKAQGFSYREIGERQGWTYTKVNRAITEGRRRFLGRFDALESGEECRRFAPTLLALVQGEAESADVVALRPHLRHCGGCRATVRELVDARRHRLALHLPFLGGVVPLRWLGERVAERPGGGADVKGVLHGLGERVAERPGGGADAKGTLHGLAGRFTAPDVASTVQLGSSGGGRGPAVAALLSLCLGGGAGTYCVATGSLPDPARLIQRADAPQPQPQRADREPVQRRPDRSAPSAAPVATATATPALRRSSAPVATHAPQAIKPSTRGTAATRRDRRDAREEFGFESAAGTSGGGGGGHAAAAPGATASVATAAAPASSGGGDGGGGGSAWPASAGGGGGGAGSASPAPAVTGGGEFAP